MANAKRASMREGPLAALFRKTEEEQGEPLRSAGSRAGSRPRRDRGDGPAEPEVRLRSDVEDAPPWSSARPRRGPRARPPRSARRRAPSR